MRGKRNGPEMHPQLCMFPRQSTRATMAEKYRVLLVGSGGIGTIAALNIERGGKAQVTSVLRSNYATVKEKGFEIISCEHGDIHNWRPTEGESPC